MESKTHYVFLFLFSFVCITAAACPCGYLLDGGCISCPDNNSGNSNGSAVIHQPEPLGNSNPSTTLSSNVYITTNGQIEIYFSGQAGTGYVSSSLDNTSKQNMLKKFAPNLVLSSGDLTTDGSSLEPKPVTIFTTNAKLFATYTNLSGDGIVKQLTFPNVPVNNFSLNGTLFKHYKTYFDWQGTNASEWSNEYARVKNNFKPTVYGTFFELDDYYGLQYYLFFPYNDFVNDHEGDWENVNIFIKKSEPDQIYAIEYQFHHKWIRIRNKAENAGLIDIVNNHPILYLGGRPTNLEYFGGTNNFLGNGNGSHGIFPYPAVYKQVEDASQVNEEVDGRGKTIWWNSYNLEFVLDDSGNNAFYYNAYWGNGTDNVFCNNQVVNGVVNSFVGLQKSPKTRTSTDRWKKLAKDDSEGSVYTTNWPSRDNSLALQKIKNNPNGPSSLLSSLLSLLLD